MLAAAISLAIGWSCFRLKGHYFAMATIAVAEIIQIIFTNWEFAGSAVGLTCRWKEGWALDASPPRCLTTIWRSGCCCSRWRVTPIEKSYLGYYFRAIKDEPDAARSLGVNLSRYKQMAFAISSFFTALAAVCTRKRSSTSTRPRYCTPACRSRWRWSSILGGVGTLFGPMVGAGVLTLIEEGTRIIFGGTGRGTDLIIYAGMIVVIAVYYPTGVIGGGTSMCHCWRRAEAAQAERHRAKW